MTRLLFAPLMVLALAAPSLTVADTAPLQDTVKVLKVEYVPHRKPPFKRRWVEVNVADIASAEIVEAVATESVSVRKLQAGVNRKPPYKQKTVEVPVVDVAASELVEETEAREPKPAKRRRPPFNRHR